MKKYVISLFSVLFMFVMVCKAQQPTGPQKPKGPSIENRVDKMATDLGLSEVEKSALKDLLTKQDADIKKFRAENDKDSPEFKNKYKEFRKSQEAELKTTLGEEKFNKWQTIRAEMRKNTEQKPGAPALP